MSRAHMIGVCKLAALDIVFHGPRFVLAEFALGVALNATIGIMLAYPGFLHGSAQHLVATILGIALNYVPLLMYAITIVRQQSAQREVAVELAQPTSYQRMYQWQSIVLIFVPLALLVLAAVQEVSRRWQMGRPR